MNCAWKEAKLGHFSRFGASRRSGPLFGASTRPVFYVGRCCELRPYHGSGSLLKGLAGRPSDLLEASQTLRQLFAGSEERGHPQHTLNVRGPEDLSRASKASEEPFSPAAVWGTLRYPQLGSYGFLPSCMANAALLDLLLGHRRALCARGDPK